MCYANLPGVRISLLNFTVSDSSVRLLNILRVESDSYFQSSSKSEILLYIFYLLILFQRLRKLNQVRKNLFQLIQIICPISLLCFFLFNYFLWCIVYKFFVGEFFINTNQRTFQPFDFFL